MKAIVFGGTGFIGSHVVEQLQLGGHTVTAAVRNTSNIDFLERLGVEILRIDFSNKEEISNVIKGHSVVYNCTADTHLGTATENQEEPEIQLARTLITLAAEEGVSRFIQLSTIVVYDFQTSEPIAETYVTKPEYPIQRIKLEKDKIVKEIGVREGISTIIVRPASAIGLRDVTSFFSRLLTAHEHDQFPLARDGEASVSLVNTRDIGRAMVLLGEISEQNSDNGIYLVKGFDTTWGQLKEEIDRVVGRKAMVTEVPKTDTSFAGKTLQVNRIWDDSKIRALGFKPEFSLQETVVEAINDIKK
ncbi:MAG: NAD(P)-dependent oxidoreductase [Bacillus sp. (in: firmicutes)]